MITKSKLNILTIFLSLIFIFFLVTSLKEEKISEVIKVRLVENNQEITNQINKFKEAVKLKNINLIKSQFALLRLNYKKYQYLYEYIDPEMIKRNINSAPLSWTNYKDPTPKIYEPKGIQVIEELIYEKDVDYKKLSSLIENLENDFNNLFLLVNYTKLQDRFVFEAIRFELIRLISFSMTGFDSPTSLHSIPEIKISLETIKKDLILFEKYTDNKNVKNFNKTLNLLDNSIKFVTKNKNFDSFDRITFVKLFIEPLFTLFLEIQLELNIETYKETTNKQTIFNYLSKNIFSDDLLNPYMFTNSLNKSNPEMIKLGKMLFEDNNLSLNSKQSCRSCHLQEKAFTDGLKTNFSSQDNSNLLRNTPTLINSIYADRYFYDLRASSPEMQIEHVLLNDNEFNTDLFKILKSLQNSNKNYKDMFKNAFYNYDKDNNNLMSITNLKRALTSYLVELRSFNSKFDKYIRNEKVNNKAITLSNSEKNGFNLFMGKAMCGNCHFPPTFSGLVPPLYLENESEVLGVPSNKNKSNAIIDEDMGRYYGIQRDKLSIYRHSFKTSTVRNIDLTAPYMHNGIYDNLEEVMEFYNNGGGKGLGINLENQTLPFDNLNLKNSEIKDIINFMKTLTDTTFYKNIN